MAPAGCWLKARMAPQWIGMGSSRKLSEGALGASLALHGGGKRPSLRLPSRYHVALMVLSWSPLQASLTLQGALLKRP